MIQLQRTEWRKSAIVVLMNSATMLLHAYYGKSHILRGVNLDVGEGEIVSLLGRNGVGRSTTCKAIMGLVAPQGSVRCRARNWRACGPISSPAPASGTCPRIAKCFRP
jgi:ABC-type branched-subunit amino acid transport system ATPase component